MIFKLVQQLKTPFVKRILGYTLKHKLILTFCLIAMTISAASEPIFASLMEPLIDLGFVETSLKEAWLVPLLMVLVVLIRVIANFVQISSINWIASRMVYELRAAMYNRLLHLPTSFFNQHGSGTIIAKFIYDANQVANASANLITIIVRDSLTIVGILAYLFYLDYQLTLVFLILAPLFSAIISYTTKRLRRISTEEQNENGALTNVIEESIYGEKIIKIFSGHTTNTKRFAKINNHIRQLFMKSIVSSTGVTGSTELLGTIAIAIIIFGAILRAQTADFSAGEFVAYLFASLLIAQPIKRLSGSNAILQKGIAAAESIFAFIDQPEEIDQGDKRIFGRIDKIEFDRISFVYPHSEKPILKQLSLTINRGETVALVGASGSGKTTITNLLLRFYDPGSGKITVNGIDIKALVLSHWREQIMLVSQDTILFHDTIAANIAYSRPDISLEKIKNAAKLAYIDEFIEQLPDGYQTIIGEKGMRLSGGQKQRLAIARAVIKNAPVLILDEATSSLDTQSEDIVQNALQQLTRDRTTLVIAHRLSTIKTADRIVVMDQGLVVEHGDHSTLLAANGVYSKFWDLQFGHRK